MVVQKDGEAGILYALTHPVGYVTVKKKVVSLLKEFSKLPLPECFNLYKVVCV